MLSSSKIIFATFLLSVAINTPLFSTNVAPINLTDEEERTLKNTIKQAILQDKDSFPGKISRDNWMFTTLPDVTNTPKDQVKIVYLPL